MVEFTTEPSSYSKTVSCCVCGFDGVINEFVIKSTHTLAGVTATFLLRRCPQCGTYFNNPQWQPNILKVYYDNFEYQEHYQVNDKYALDIIKVNYINYEEYLDAAEELTNINRYLDVGCGMAVMLLEGACRGWEVWGIDISELPLQYAKRKFHLKNLFAGTFERKPEWCEYFDFISMNDYLEHTNDPNDQLDMVRFALRSGGLLQILIPNADSPTLKFYPQNIIMPPQHLWLWGRKNITVLLERHGFNVIWAKTGKSYLGQLWVNAIKR